jgi:two-component system cell cycle sensor histidine kinase/response regulator CckA
LDIFRKSLFTRLVSYFLFLSSVIVILLGIFSYRFFIKDIQNAIVEELSAVATIKEEMLIRWLNEQKQDTLQMASIPAFRKAAEVFFSTLEHSPQYEGIYNSIFTHFLVYLNNNQDFSEIFLLSAKGGKILLSTEKSFEGAYRVLDTHYIEGRERLYVQTVYPSPATLRPTMTVSTPLRDSDGRLIGVLAVNLNLKMMDSIVQEQSNSRRTAETYLIDRYNTFISGERFGSDEFPRGVHSFGIDSAINGNEGEGVYENYRGIPVIGVYRWIDILDLALLVEMEREEAFTSARGRIAPLLIIGLLLVLALAVGVYLIAKRIVKPVVAVKDAALKVAEGNLDTKVPILSEDEVGVLARSFNQMTSKLKNLYDEIRRNEEHFRALIESSSDLILVVDKQGVITFVSPSALKLLGYTSDDLLGKNAFGFVHSEDLDRMRSRIFAECVENGTSFDHVVVRWLDRSMGWISFEMTLKNLLDTPAIRGILINGRDITEKISAEHALRDSEERYRSFFEEDLTGDYIATPDGAIVSCNPAFAHIFGFPSVDVVMRHNLYSFYPDAFKFESFLELLRAKKRLEYHEKEMRNIEGKRIYVVENAIGRFDQKGELVEIKGYIFDNTERKQLEEKLYQVQKMEAVGRLAGGIAHDFNNLLTAIIGYSEMILMEGAREDISGEEETYENVREIKKAADRAASLTQQLLAYSRKQMLQPKVIDINHLVSNMELMLQRLIGEDIQLHTRLDPTLMPIKADPGQIEQVIMNLVVNSRDAMPKGGRVSIETKNMYLDEKYCAEFPEISPGLCVLMSVSDTGYGMDEETREKIFDPFFTTKEIGKGTGLGLSTVFGIVKQSGGHITVVSELGKGTTFNVCLPVMDETDTVQRAVLHEGGIQNGSESILVVEDEDVVRRMICKALMNNGYHVYEAEGPISALGITEKMNEEDIELMITDIVMPQMNGKKLARKLLKHFKTMKVLYISGYTEEAIIQQGILEKNAPYLQKPFTPEELAKRVRELLDAP